MKLLGAILMDDAGQVEPSATIDGIAAALAGQCTGVVAVGRHWPSLPFVAERRGLYPA